MRPKSILEWISTANRISHRSATLSGLILLIILLIACSVACSGSATPEPVSTGSSTEQTPQIAATNTGSSLSPTTPPTTTPLPTPIVIPTPTSTPDPARCLFSPYSIGGEVPVYHSPDVNSPIVTNIAWGEKYPVLDRQGEWHFERSGSSGQFYQIQLDELNIGWVLDMRGGLEGNCAPYQDQVKKPPIYTGQSSPANDCSFKPSAVIHNALSSARPVRVIYIAEDGIRLWDEESDTAELLFEAGDITSLAFSDDHQLIAFTRRNAERQASVWVMDGQDQGARELLSPEGLLALNLSEDKDLAVDPYILRWIPGSHQLAFSTRTTTVEDGPPDVFQELRVLDADTGSLSQLLDHHQGGTYTYSPDGAFFALVSDTSISLYRSNGELIAADIVTYPPLGISEHYHHPPIYWDADSRFFTFAVVNAADTIDAIYNPDVTSTIWRVRVDGSAERLATIQGLSLDHTFSPDLEKIAFMRVSPKGPPLREMHIADVYYAWDIVYREGDSLTFGDWNPAEQALHFTFFDGWGEPGIGRLCYDPVPLPSVSGPGFTRRVGWVDATRYLYTTHPGETLHLGSIKGTQKLVGQVGQEQVTSETGPLKVYDFYASPSATSSIPLPDNAQPMPALPGMIYEDEEGVWLVQSDSWHPAPLALPVITVSDWRQLPLTSNPKTLGEANTLFPLPVRVDGIPFVVRVGDEPIYSGAFWTPLSSLSYDGFIILQPLGDQDEKIGLTLGYPSPLAFTGEDPRADRRIIEALGKAGKLK